LSRGSKLIRSDNGPAMRAYEVKRWPIGIGTKTSFIKPGTP
jgi:hypothetical protein